MVCRNPHDLAIAPFGDSPASPFVTMARCGNGTLDGCVDPPAVVENASDVHGLAGFHPEYPFFSLSQISLTTTTLVLSLAPEATSRRVPRALSYIRQVVASGRYSLKKFE